MKLEFAGILNRAMQIAWNHRILWMFSVPAGLATSLICLSIFIFNSEGSLIRADIKDKILRTADNLPPFTVLIFCFTVFLFYIFSLLGSTGIIKGVSELENKKTIYPSENCCLKANLS